MTHPAETHPAEKDAGTEPPWNSGDPQQWETYWEAWYQIADAKPVLVEGHARTERKALDAAEAALSEALKTVSDLGLCVEASCWTVKHRSRRQSQRFDRTNVKEYVTADWYGRITQVAKSVHLTRVTPPEVTEAGRG